MYNGDRRPAQEGKLQMTMMELMQEQGLYRDGDHEFVDLDVLVENVDDVIYTLLQQHLGR